MRVVDVVFMLLCWQSGCRGCRLVLSASAKSIFRILVGVLGLSAKVIVFLVECVG